MDEKTVNGGGGPDRVRTEIGRRLRVLRMAKGMSLRDAASRADLSATFVGLVEKGSTEIAISRLIRLADAYGAVVADLLADMHEPRAEFVPADQSLQVSTNVEGVEIRYLASPSWTMEPFRVQLEPGASLTGLSHASEEFIHCIEGHTTLVVGDESHNVGPGDTLLVPPLAEHAYVNDSDGVVILIGAVQRPESAYQEAEPIWRQAVRDAVKAREGEDSPNGGGGWPSQSEVAAT
jgi:quercetin dioxygenase-like cupin family protein